MNSKVSILEIINEFVQNWLKISCTLRPQPEADNMFCFLIILLLNLFAFQVKHFYKEVDIEMLDVQCRGDDNRLEIPGKVGR